MPERRLQLTIENLHQWISTHTYTQLVSIIHTRRAFKAIGMLKAVTWMPIDSIQSEKKKKKKVWWLFCHFQIEKFWRDPPFKRNNAHCPKRIQQLIRDFFSRDDNKRGGGECLYLTERDKDAHTPKKDVGIRRWRELVSCHFMSDPAGYIETLLMASFSMESSGEYIHWWGRLQERERRAKFLVGRAGPSDSIRFPFQLDDEGVCSNEFCKRRKSTCPTCSINISRSSSHSGHTQLALYTLYSPLFHLYLFSFQAEREKGKKKFLLIRWQLSALLKIDVA